MKQTRLKFSKLTLAALTISLAGAFSSCKSDDDPTPAYPVTVTQSTPTELGTNAVVKSGQITLTEINTGSVTTLALPLDPDIKLTTGTYNVEGQMTVETVASNGETVEKTLRAVANQVVISQTSSAISLNWFFFNPTSSLVFSEIYFAGSPNAAGTNGLYDTFIRIYNNTDETIYADGLAIVESKFLNSSTDKILTAANDPEANFTAQTVYVIPGSGKDVAILPGKSIKIVDQAIDWNEQVAGALNHTDADFEWYDETTSASIKDTDNPAVPNLDKWYSYSATIWIPSNQCNRSYALVRFPEGMNADAFLAQQKGDYQYVNAATGKEMSGTKCYLIKNEWIIDGVNLCPTEKWTRGALSASVDMSYSAISDKNLDKARFGKKFVRRESGVSSAGNTILMDTNDSAADFVVTSAK